MFRVINIYQNTFVDNMLDKIFLCKYPEVEGLQQNYELKSRHECIQNKI